MSKSNVYLLKHKIKAFNSCEKTKSFCFFLFSLLLETRYFLSHDSHTTFVSIVYLYIFFHKTTNRPSKQSSTQKKKHQGLLNAFFQFLKLQNKNFAPSIKKRRSFILLLKKSLIKPAFQKIVLRK